MAEKIYSKRFIEFVDCWEICILPEDNSAGEKKKTQKQQPMEIKSIDRFALHL